MYGLFSQRIMPSFKQCREWKTSQEAPTSQSSLSVFSKQILMEVENPPTQY